MKLAQKVGFVASIGSHHNQVAMLVPDDKLDGSDLTARKFCVDKNGLAFYLRPVMPPRSDGSSFEKLHYI